MYHISWWSCGAAQPFGRGYDATPHRSQAPGRDQNRAGSREQVTDA
ncbi:hypothetical protein [Acidithiobacillus concretivorus]|uniref:Uncharacterized protein n=1 Tax=Acidithiobacillus concretivorus TaxID=3063952 RepID=A0ABS5ZNZ6_9PROT|nr:hypothetical protein [Acidithiobacillus concretivorus]MBU2737898.1 hypothetical protein [Acidithiobacillus concretivorus]